MEKKKSYQIIDVWLAILDDLKKRKRSIKRE